jgi:surface carbohydrate biosynthesis protein
MNVQIVIDNTYRDFLPSLLIKKYVERHSSHRVYLSNKMNLSSMYAYVKPSIIMVPHTQSFLSDLIPRLSRNSDVCILYTEGGYATDIALHGIHDDSRDGVINKNYVRRAYVWGESVKQALLRLTIFRDDQLIVSGNPRFDIYRVFSENGERMPKRCGVATTLRQLTGINKQSLMETIRFRSQLGETSIAYWNKGGQFADYMWFEVATVELLNCIFKNLIARNVEKQFYLRPHPFESVDHYHSFKRDYDMVVYNHEPILNMLRKVYVYVCAFSTSAFDALMAGVPVISLRKLYDKTRGKLLIKEVLYENTDFLLWQPETFEEFVDMVRDAQQGKLPIAPDMNKVSEYLDSCYNYSHPRLATQIVGDDVIAQLSSRSKIRHKNYSAFLTHSVKEIGRHIFRYKKGDYHYSPLRHYERKTLNILKKEISKVVAS